jgi:hypothetical protein
MENEIHDIQIFPAKFIEKRGENYLIRCLIEKEYTEDRLFEEYSLRGIENPNLVFISIVNAIGITQINFYDANEFEDLFKKKWNVLLK